MDIIMNCLSSVGIAIGISFLFYLSKREKGESFELRKALRTLVIGVVVGFVAHFKGVQITQENFEAFVAGSGFITIISDKLFALTWNFYQSRF